MSSATAPGRKPVPWRTILATIGLVLGTVATLFVLDKIGRVLTWIVVAGFLALVLNPVVNVLTTRGKIRRGAAVAVTVILAFGLVVAMLYAFIRPLVEQASVFSDNFPAYVEDVKNGEGSVGKLVKRYDLDRYIDDNREQLRSQVSGLGARGASVVTGVFSTLTAILTVIVLTILFLIEGEKVVDGALKAIPPPHRERVRRVARDCSKAVTGYMGGNLLISVIAGVATFIFLSILGVPFAGVLALWVAFADLIPLIGATLGAIVTCGVAFLDSPKSGIAALIFYVLYQQFENHVLAVSIMSRTVKLNPLTVLISVLVGVELFGILGALLAIPVAGILQVIVRDVYDEDLGMLKDEPTVGEDEVPISETIRDELADRADLPEHAVPDEAVEAVAEGAAEPLPGPVPERT